MQYLDSQGEINIQHPRPGIEPGSPDYRSGALIPNLPHKTQFNSCKITDTILAEIDLLLAPCYIWQQIHTAYSWPPCQIGHIRQHHLLLQFYYYLGSSVINEHYYLFIGDICSQVVINYYYS